MADLYDVVNFSAARDARLADRGAVNGRARAYLNIIFNHDAPGLRNLQPAPLLVLRVAEAVRADDGVVVHDDARAQTRALAQTDAGVQN